MLIQLTAVVVDADAANRHEMATFLAGHGVQVLAELSGVEQLAAVLGRGAEAPQLVVLNLDPSPQDTLRRVAPFVRQHVAVNFFVLSHVLDARLLMDAIHLGVKEFIPLPVEEDKFRQGLERVAQAVAPAERARIINVVPAAGGCGATTVACNVAAALARKGRTALVDLDMARGTVAMSFDVRPRYTIADVIGSADQLDKQLLDNALVQHKPTGLSVLARPEMPEDAQRVTPAGLGRLLNVLGRSYQYVVLDSPMDVGPVHAVAAKAADLNVLVMELNVPTVKNAERFIAALQRIGVERDRLRLVVNRHTKRRQSESDVDAVEAERLLRSKIAWTVPNDFRNAVAALNLGEPVVVRAPRAEISTSLCGLAGELNGKAH